MTIETALWTVLPNGLDPTGDFLRFTVFVSPRLDTEGAGQLELGDFRAFARWPDALNLDNFVIEIDGFGAEAARLDPDSLKPDGDVWNLVLPPDTAVGTHEFTNLATKQVRSFPAAIVANYVESFYAKVAATSPTVFAPATSGPVGGLIDDMRRMERGTRLVDGLFGDAPDGVQIPEVRFIDQFNLGANATQLAFAQTRRFYDRPNTRDPLGPDVIPDPPREPEIDFHGIVAFLGDYPKLLRRLGLAIDLVIERAWNPPQFGRVRVHPGDAVALDDAGNLARQPWTNYVLDDTLFITRTRDREGFGDFADGMVRLEDTRLFRINQIDIDGSALKLMDFAENAGRVADHVRGAAASMTPDALSVPALRSAGFTVTRLNRAEGVVDTFDLAAQRQQQIPTFDPFELFAEDVTRGIHVDVFDERDWRSLCSRVGVYTVTTNGGVTEIDIPPDEGFVKAASVTRVPDVGAGSDHDLYLHESVFGWDGWSLVAKRPGQPVLDEGAGPPATGQTSASPLSTVFVPQPGTLPRLRYGGSYVFRALAVDLAGNRINADVIRGDHESPRTTFLRYEPVPSPEVFPRRVFGEGESVLRMVIRSTLGVSVDDYVQLPNVTNLVGHTDPGTAYITRDDRHLAPPKTSQQMAEWHGMFDDAFGDGASAVDRDAAFVLSELADGTFMQPGIGAVVTNPDPAQTPTDLTAPGFAKGDTLKSGEYVLLTPDLVDLPYLPDVFARGMSMVGLPGTTGVTTFDWSGSWPKLEPIRLRIVEGSGPPTLVGRELTVLLEKAELAEVRLSSFFGERDLDQMGIPSLAPFATAATRKEALDGLHWMLTPASTLVLVHAVEKPLVPPTIVVPAVGVKRQSGDTFAVLEGTIDNHAASTGRLDVAATWPQWVDDPIRPEPIIQDGASHVGNFLIERHETSASTGRDDIPGSFIHELRHEFGDTKHRRVTYTATATTRYREYFPTEVTDNADRITHVGPTTELVVPSSRRPDPPAVLYSIPTFTWSSGVSKFSWFTDFAPVAMMPDVAVLPDVAVHRSAAIRISRRGIGEIDLDRIVQPQVRNTWVRRSGGGLRVWLDRPWFSSGDGELLGVVIKRQPWINWGLDLDVGLTVSDAARLDADRFATAVFDSGLAQATGDVAALPVTERLQHVLTAMAERHQPVDTVRAAIRSELDLASIVTEVDLGRWVDVLFPKGDAGPFTTAWGKDPIWGSVSPSSGPTINQFPLRTAVGYKVALEEVNADVTVVGHQPEFDPERRLWFCDIDIDAGDAYTPFVKLGLVRYQPNSIAGHHISRVVMTDFIQLLPERVLTHSRRGRSMSLTLRGPGGYSRLAEQMVGAANANGPAGLSRSRFAEVQVEQRATTSTSDLEWVAVGDAVPMVIQPDSTVANVVYAGSVTVPDTSDDTQVRVAVREFDMLATDQSQLDSALLGLFPITFPFGSFNVEPVKHRLVYASHVDL